MNKINEHYLMHGQMLGAPVDDEHTCPDGIGKYRHYQNGSIHYHPDTGAYETHGGIRGLWARMGWEASFLGYPVSDEFDYTTQDYLIGVLGDPYMEEPLSPLIRGRCSFFQGGCIVWWSAKEMRAQSGEYMLLLRPNGLGNWQPVAYEKNLIDAVRSWFSPQDEIIQETQISILDIPSDYGRKVWVKG